MAGRRTFSLSCYERDRKRRQRNSRRDRDERAQRHACRRAISFRGEWRTDRESVARDLSWARNVVDLSETFFQSTEKHLITREDLRPHAEEIAVTSRLLVKTGRWSDWTVFQIVSR